MRSTRVLVEVAILVAMAFVLEIAFSFLPAMPQGGRVSLSVLPIIVISWRNGPYAGIVGGVVYGLLNLMLDGVLYHWGSFFLDYTIAFGLIGLSGLVRKAGLDNVGGFGLAIFVGYLLRFLSHTLSGVLLFSQYAGDENVWLYSLGYQTTYLLPAFLLTLVVGVIVYFPLKTLENNEH